MCCSPAEAHRNASKKGFGTLCVADHITVVTVSLTLNVGSLESLFVSLCNDAQLVKIIDHLKSAWGPKENVQNFPLIEKHFIRKTQYHGVGRHLHGLSPLRAISVLKHMGTGFCSRWKILNLHNLGPMR